MFKIGPFLSILRIVGSTAQTKERHDTEQAFFLFSMLKVQNHF
jgi:hypothetical protein